MVWLYSAFCRLAIGRAVGGPRVGVGLGVCATYRYRTTQAAMWIWSVLDDRVWDS